MKLGFNFGSFLPSCADNDLTNFNVQAKRTVKLEGIRHRQRHNHSTVIENALFRGDNPSRNSASLRQLIAQNLVVLYTPNGACERGPKLRLSVVECWC